MASPSEFNRRMQIRADRVGTNTTRVVRKVALTIDTILVQETPVDTGRAKSNWLVSLGVSLTGVIDAYAPGEKGSTAAANAQAALAQGETVIKNYMSGRDLSIHISNNLPYIGVLNEGSSLQAPAGFVEDAVAEAVRLVRNSHIIDP